MRSLFTVIAALVMGATAYFIVSSKSPASAIGAGSGEEQTGREGAKPLTDTPALFVGRAQSGAKLAIRDWTNAESDTLATNTVTTIDLGQELRIGSQYNDVIADAVRIHCAGIISEVVSDADMATIYARLSAHMTRRSITI